MSTMRRRAIQNRQAVQKAWRQLVRRAAVLRIKLDRDSGARFIVRGRRIVRPKPRLKRRMRA